MPSSKEKIGVLSIFTVGPVRLSEINQIAKWNDIFQLNHNNRVGWSFPFCILFPSAMPLLNWSKATNQFMEMEREIPVQRGKQPKSSTSIGETWIFPSEQNETRPCHLNSDQNFWNFWLNFPSTSTLGILVPTLSSPASIPLLSPPPHPILLGSHSPVPLH